MITESGRWRTVTELIAPQLAPQPRRVEGGRHPLAPRRGAQPGEVHHVGALLELAGALRGGRRVGLALGVDQHHLGEPQQRVHRLAGGRAATRRRWRGRSPRAGPRSCPSSARWLLADVHHHLLVVERELARARGRPPPSSWPGVELSCARARPRRGWARGVVAADALEPVEDLAAPLAVHDHHEVEHPRRARRPRPRRGAA